MANNAYTDILLTVNAVNAPTVSSPISVTLASEGGANVAWSTGQAGSSSSGITLTNTTPATPIPLQSFLITASNIDFQTAQGASGGFTFTLSVFLVADPTIQFFGLSYQADAGVTVSLTLSGSQPVFLQTTPQIYQWPAS